MKTIYIKFVHQDGKDWFWKHLCVVFDNEALGYLERLLTANKIEYKVEDTP